MSEHGKYVTKLITRFFIIEIIPKGGGVDDALKYFQDREHRKRVTDAAEKKAIAAIELVKTAPDNPFGDDDERIAQALLSLDEKRRGT